MDIKSSMRAAISSPALITRLISTVVHQECATSIAVQQQGQAPPKTAGYEQQSNVQAQRVHLTYATLRNEGFNADLCKHGRL
jgi:hypothetical protein